MGGARQPPQLGPVAATLLGTRIYELAIAAADDVLLISDLHLRPETSAELDAFLAVLDGVADGGLALILGDLFDYWVGRPQLRQAAWRAVPRVLAEAAARGVRCYALHGNRDYQLDRAFERATGARVVRGGLLLRASGARPLCCLHGDELCTNDRGYQRSKRVLRSVPVRLGLHAMPFAVSRRLADKAREVSKRSVAAADPATLNPSRAAIARLSELGDVNLLFGHIHRAAACSVSHDRGRVAFWVLPAFETPSCGHARWLPGGAPRLVLDGRPVPWPEGCPLGP